MGDPAIGNRSVVVVDFEQSWGVAKAVPKGRKISIVECSILPNRGLIPNPSLRSGWNPAKPFPGAPKPAGTIQIVPNVQVLPFFQKLITGTLVKTGAAAPWLATSELGNTMPASAIIEGSLDINGTMKYARATGVRVNNWTIPIAHEGPLLLNLGVKAKNVTYEDVAYDAALDDWTIEDPIDQAFLITGAVKVGGVTVGYVKGGQLTGDAKLQDDPRAGLLGNGSLVPMTHGLGGNLDIALESVGALTLVTGGGVTDLEFVWQVAVGRSWGVTYHVVLEPTGPAIKDGLINVPVTFQGFEDPATGTGVEFESSIGVDPDTEYI